MLVSKENLGCVILLLLVILLSLAKSFDILIDTPLGRIILLLFVLILSYMNKILGVVSVLFIIIIFSGSNNLYFEGFDTNTTSNVQDSKVDDNKTKDDKDKSQVQKGDNTLNITQSTNSDINTPTPSKNISSQPTEPTKNDPLTTQSIASPTTTEGFDIIGLENDIKKGKQSNSIPVSAFMKESQFVSAYEANPFKEDFYRFN